MHLHTDFSDGENTPGEMAEAAISLGYDAIAFTDHVWRSSDWLDEYIAVIDNLKRLYAPRIRIYTGVEAKITDRQGNIDFDDRYHSKLDFVLAAFHRIPLGNNEYLHLCDIPENPESCLDIWINTLENALRNPVVDGIAHPFNIIPMMKEAWTENTESELLRLFRENHKIIDFNIRHNHALLTDFWRNPDLKIIFSSDSHSVHQMATLSEKLISGEKLYMPDNYSFPILQ